MPTYDPNDPLAGPPPAPRAPAARQRSAVDQLGLFGAPPPPAPPPTPASAPAADEHAPAGADIDADRLFGPVAAAAAGQTVAEAREVLRQALRAGPGHCPCCGRTARIYRRVLHAEMAAFLCRLVREYRRAGGRGWVNLRDVVAGGDASAKASTDGAYLVHWGLVVPFEGEPGEKRPGYYKPTERGVAFADGALEVQSHVLLYDNRRLGFDGDLIDVKTALGTKFSYAELMGGPESA
jgi:hypothetical protein